MMTPRHSAPRHDLPTQGPLHRIGAALCMIAGLFATILTTSPAGAAEGASKTMLGFYYDALGPLYGLLFLLGSITLLAYAIINVFATRLGAIAPLRLARDFAARLDSKQLPEALELVREHHSMLGKLLAAGMSKVASGGYIAAMNAIREAAAQHRFRLLARLNLLLIVALALLLLGVLATADGLTGSFLRVTQSADAGRPSQLSLEAAASLVPLRLGLYLSIPALLLYAALRNRLPLQTEHAIHLSDH